MDDQPSNQKTSRTSFGPPAINEDSVPNPSLFRTTVTVNRFTVSICAVSRYEFRQVGSGTLPGTGQEQVGEKALQRPLPKRKDIATALSAKNVELLERNAMRVSRTSAVELSTEYNTAQTASVCCGGN